MGDRLFLLGGSGRLGRALLGCAEEGGGWTCEAPGHGALDLAAASEEELRAVLKVATPGAVINCAALALVDRCSEEPELAMGINGEAPGRLARACAGLGLPLLHISTDYVFGDIERCGPPPYAEGAPTGPVQIYGESKVAGERAVLAAGGNAAIVRVSWLFGPTGGAFERFVLDQLDAGSSRVSVRRAARSRPTFLPDLARWLLDVAGFAAAGGALPEVLHPSGGEGVSREQWARALLDAAGRAEVVVVEQRGSASRAGRPEDSVLDGRWSAEWGQRQGIERLVDWRRGLGE